MGLLLRPLMAEVDGRSAPRSIEGAEQAIRILVDPAEVGYMVGNGTQARGPKCVILNSK